MSTTTRPRDAIRAGLRIGAIEAFVAGGMFACTETWLIPLLQTHLGAATFVIVLLTIVPQLAGISLGPFTRMIVAWFGGNKPAAYITAIMQAVLLASLSLPLHAKGEPWAIPVAATMIILFGIIGAVGGAGWLAWMGSLIPRSLQGPYTGKRNRLFQVSRLSCAGLFALIIHFLPIAHTTAGLQTILILATLSRSFSVMLLMRQIEPPSRPHLPEDHGPASVVENHGFWHFLTNLTATPFGTWTLVWGALHIGVMISGPYFASYMLATPEGGGLGLGASPFTFTLLIYTSTIARLVTYPVAGRLVDHHGSAAILRIAVMLITLIPIGWMASSTLWVIIVFEILSGVGWCLAEISLGPVLFSCHRDPQQRARMIGWNQSVVMACILIGSTLGMFLMAAPWLPAMTGSQYHTLFLISMIMRIPAVILALRLLPSLREVPPDLAEHVGLWRLIPGAGLTVTVGRGLGGFFRRTEGE
jgi:hypothetical protein